MIYHLDLLVSLRTLYNNLSILLHQTSFFLFLPAKDFLDFLLKVTLSTKGHPEIKPFHLSSHYQLNLYLLRKKRLLL